MTIKEIVSQRKIIEYIALTFPISWTLLGIMLVANKLDFLIYGIVLGMILIVIIWVTPAVSCFLLYKKKI
jgi:hypothetical protein